MVNSKAYPAIFPPYLVTEFTIDCFAEFTLNTANGFE